MFVLVPPLPYYYHKTSLTSNIQTTYWHFISIINNLQINTINSNLKAPAQRIAKCVVQFITILSSVAAIHQLSAASNVVLKPVLQLPASTIRYSAKENMGCVNNVQMKSSWWEVMITTTQVDETSIYLPAQEHQEISSFCLSNLRFARFHNGEAMVCNRF